MTAGIPPESGAEAKAALARRDSPWAKIILGLETAGPWGRSSVKDRVYWADEVESAGRVAQEWARQWLEPQEMRAWLSVIPNIWPETARSLTDVGISPGQASQRIWYGKLNPGRPSIAQRVQSGAMTAEVAIQLSVAG